MSATSTLSAAAPANATLRGVVSLGAGTGGSATGLAGAAPPPGSAGSCQVRAATASRLPAPTMLEDSRAPRCAVAVSRRTTSVAFSPG
ncbi:Uncharacterised protein [Mycobacterium tuberculosis]|nr:Uncharacterised protein [Mycobacterium tuberculosis]